MEEEKISFSVRLTTKEIFRFTFYHEYTRITGIIGLCISLGALIVLLASFDTWIPQTKAILIFASLWYTVIQPVFLLNQARKQAKRNKAKAEPFQYQIDSEGITISQGEAKQTAPWDHFVRIVETKSQYFVYSDRVHAFIFPKDSIGIDSEAFDEKILGFLGQIKITLKGPIKKMRKQMPVINADDAKEKNIAGDARKAEVAERENAAEKADTAEGKNIVGNTRKTDVAERENVTEKADAAEYGNEE